MIALATAAMVMACTVSEVTDGDTFVCTTGERVRLQGVEANERSGGCHLPVCPTMSADMARYTLMGLVLNRRVECERVGISYRRITAFCRLPDGRDASCELIRAGAGLRWAKYDPNNRLKGC